MHCFSILGVNGPTCAPCLSSSCPIFPDCGFTLPNSGVVLSCLNCFLRTGSLYSFEYGVSPSVFLSKVRGGTCTTAVSDPPEMVIHRAMHLLQNGFGNYDVFQNNCEDFALYCKTGLLTLDRLGVGRSGQASSVVGAPLAALLSSPLKFLIPSPVGVATVTAGMYCMSRYATDIGVRSDVIKVAVEDLAVNLGWGSSNEGAIVEHDDSIHLLDRNCHLAVHMCHHIRCKNSARFMEIPGRNPEKRSIPWTPWPSP
ncbi:hypothetical protein MTR67_004983 [Solanum verrucosum]|uniref:LRAT domain-containing protein n=1 Tax=Solanum verrucosum TaxID=315347 RepID=A0AAF0PVK5_SOLVR|nr:hypothetical protein MTR67_004983 [Solanum verrucosum]